MRADRAAAAACSDARRKTQGVTLYRKVYIRIEKYTDLKVRTTTTYRVTYVDNDTVRGFQINI